MNPLMNSEYNCSMVCRIPEYCVARLTYANRVDTPFPINPFTFKAEHIGDAHPHKCHAASTHSSFAVPQLPSRLNNLTLESGATPSQNPVAPAHKKPAQPPKTTFPDIHMPFLVAKIGELDTGNMTFIVESLYQELRNKTKDTGAPVVKKNAIEAKVREVTEKDKKIWIVKPDVKVCEALWFCDDVLMSYLGFVWHNVDVRTPVVCFSCLAFT